MLKVKKSKIPDAGKGLFTLKPINKGEIVVEYVGERMSREWCKRFHAGEIPEDELIYIFEFSKYKIIDAANCLDEPGRYANDANGSIAGDVENNCEFDVVKGKAYIRAIKDIPAKAEILVDYGPDYWE